MKTINAHLIGRFGNQCFGYCYARKFAEINGLELRTNKWPGQILFSSVNEKELVPGGDQLPEHYRQDQESLIYTLLDVGRYLMIDPRWVRSGMAAWGSNYPMPLAHRRVGDYATTPGYPVISTKSYIEFATRINLPFAFVTEEAPSFDPTHPLPWMNDFIRMVFCPVLIRGNSSFSWWAATLNRIYSDGKIFAPVIDGVHGSFIEAGKPAIERDVQFVEGNWPKLADLPGITDLHLEL